MLQVLFSVRVVGVAHESLDKATPSVMFLLLLHRFARRTQLSSCQNSCSSMYLSRNMFKDTMTAIPLSFLKRLDILDTHIFVMCSLAGLFKLQNGGFLMITKTKC